MKAGKPFLVRGKWGIRWTDERGRRRKQLFERHADAAHALTVERARAEEVRRGTRQPTPASLTYDDLADHWIKLVVPGKRSGYHDESIIRAHLRPFFGRMQLAKIGLAESRRYQREKSKLSPKTIHNHLTLLITQLNEALELGLVSRVPRLGKPKVSIFDEDYEYLRTDEEVGRFLRTAFADGELVGTLYATAVYTGMREGELAGLKWDKVNFETRLITVDHSFEGRTKSNRVRYVPILDPILQMLKSWRLKTSGGFVFPNQLGAMHLPSSRIFQETLHRVLDAAGFEKKEKGGRPRYYIRFHDLRHTFASHWMMNGGDIFRLSKILGHQSVQMRGRGRARVRELAANAPRSARYSGQRPQVSVRRRGDL